MMSEGAPLTLNTQRLKELIEATKAAAAGGDSAEEAITFFEAIQREPTMARPQWVDAELTSLATQWGMHAERNEWIGSFRPKYWRGPSSMTEAKITHPPTGLAPAPAAVSSPQPVSNGPPYASAPSLMQPPSSSSSSTGGLVMGSGGSHWAPPAYSQQPAGQQAVGGTHVGSAPNAAINGSASPTGAAQQQQHQQNTVNPKSLKLPAYSRCPFGTFVEDADTLIVRMGS